MPEAPIRHAAPEDFDAIARVVGAAFGRTDEADLVERLRADGLIAIELVAERNDAVAGHVAFSLLDVSLDGSPLPALALAPVSVLPRFQSHGLGGALIRTGHDIARADGFDASFVLGHPRYYPRFGYEAALAVTFEGPFKGPAFMALALRPGALDGRHGTVTYPPAFGV